MVIIAFRVVDFLQIRLLKTNNIPTYCEFDWNYKFAICVGKKIANKFYKYLGGKNTKDKTMPNGQQIDLT